jgi:glycosyltransferase involved in cell wall biosynthesis
VARFNGALSKALQIPMLDIDTWVSKADYDSKYLFSVKPSEFDQRVSDMVSDSLSKLNGKHWVFFHEFNQTDIEIKLAEISEKAIAVDRIIGSAASKFLKDVDLGFAPGLKVASPEEESDVVLLTMGMAHKINQTGYTILDEVVKTDSRSFQLRVTVAIHEGFDIGETFVNVPEQVGANWSSHLVFLGFLSDQAMSSELRKCDAVVIFPQLGARESNSSIIGAMAHGAAVVTALDSNSPSWMVHGQTIIDVRQLKQFPSSEELNRIGRNAKEAVESFTFENLAKDFLS